MHCLGPLMPSVVDISADLTQRGYGIEIGIEIGKGRNDSEQDHRPTPRHGSAPPTRRMPVELSIPLVRNIFAPCARTHTLKSRPPHMSPKGLGPPNFGHFAPTAKIASEWKNGDL